MPSTPISEQNNPTQDMASFEVALQERRRLVYDYLDSWPGAESFKPQDIHDALFSYVRRRGKALRPSLLMLCCGAVGGDEMQALPAAAAVEIFQVWTLVHDDIIDRDDLRRGGPTVHARYTAHAREVYGLPAAEAAHYGTSVAILAGDLQQSWAYALLSDLTARGVSAALVMKLVRRMSASLTPQLLEGEMLDVQFAFARQASLSEDDILQMLTKKTAALLEYAAWAGATIGLGGKPDTHNYADTLGRFASLCGIAFQLHDDLLGLTADENLLGKPVGSDIREGKRTLIMYRALASVDDVSRTKLLSVLGNEGATPLEIAGALVIIKECGALQAVGELANEYISQALQLLEKLPESEYKHYLRSWASFMLTRKY